MNVNQNENETGNKSGGTCEKGAKRPLVGVTVFPRFVSGFVFVLIYVYFNVMLMYYGAYVLRLAVTKDWHIKIQAKRSGIVCPKEN